MAGVWSPRMSASSTRARSGRNHSEATDMTIDPRIVGTWRLKSTSGRDDAGAVLLQPYGALAMGLVVFQADGRMMAVLCDGRAALATAEPRQFMSYAGNYTFDGTLLSTQVDASSDASRVGGDPIRHVSFKDGLMVLAPPRRLYAAVMQNQELAWERIAA